MLQSTVQRRTVGDAYAPHGWVRGANATRWPPSHNVVPPTIAGARQTQTRGACFSLPRSLLPCLIMVAGASPPLLWWQGDRRTRRRLLAPILPSAVTTTTMRRRQHDGGRRQRWQGAVRERGGKASISRSLQWAEGTTSATIKRKTPSSPIPTLYQVYSIPYPLKETAFGFEAGQWKWQSLDYHLREKKLWNWLMTLVLTIGHMHMCWQTYWMFCRWCFIIVYLEFYTGIMGMTFWLVVISIFLGHDFDEQSWITQWHLCKSEWSERNDKLSCH